MPRPAGLWSGAEGLRTPETHSPAVGHPRVRSTGPQGLCPPGVPTGAQRRPAMTPAGAPAGAPGGEFAQELDASFQEGQASRF